MAAAKKNLPARRPSRSQAVVVPSAREVAQEVAGYIHAEVAPALQITARIEDAVKALVGATNGPIQGHKEAFFLRRLEAMAAYGRGEASDQESWVERDLADASVPRGALSVASAFGLNREFIEQVYAQYVDAYQGAFRRFREKYPQGRPAAGCCFACGQKMPEGM